MHPGDAGSKFAPPPVLGVAGKMRAAPPSEQSARKAKAIVTSPGQKRRNRASRDKWQDLKLKQTAVATLARPRKLSELRSLSSKDILQPEGGFIRLPARNL